MNDSFSCLSCNKKYPASQRRHPTSNCCQLCWYRQYPIFPFKPSNSNHLYFPTLILNPQVDMVHYPPIHLRDLTREYDGWTFPSRTPIRMQSGVCDAPPHAIWLGLYLPCFIPDESEMDIQVTPVFFNKRPREVLLQYKAWNGPFIIRDDGRLEEGGPDVRLFKDFQIPVV